MRKMAKNTVGLLLGILILGGVLWMYQLKKPVRTNIPDRMKQHPETQQKHQKISIAPKAKQLPGKIVFASNHTGKYRIYLLMKGKLTPITQPDRPVSYPRLSPDGRFVVYQKKIGNQWDLFMYDTVEKKTNWLTHTLTNEENPAWSPDGQFIYFDSDRKGVRQIFRYHIKTKKVEQITFSNFAKNALPAVSPHSSNRIAITTSRWWGWSVGILDLETNKAQIVQKGNACRPDWNPVQPFLAYVSMKWDGKGDIALYNLDTKKVINLTPDRPETYDYDPAWSPDGQDILFQSTKNKKHGNWDIYLLTPSTGKWVRLIWGPGQQIYPDWSK